MKICGVIAEYNPFHTGHALQLTETRRVLGDDTAIVCVMSGNYVQRGDLAVMEKYRRAQVAAQCGADLVLELPLGAALSSAEGFARGGVRALDALGAVGFLSFGSECGSTRALLRAMDALEQPRVQRAFQAALHEGLSYAAARQKALAAVDTQSAALLSTSNNTLGLEYCRAIAAEGSLLTPFSIRRRGAAHDSSIPAEDYASASLLRSHLAAQNLAACAPYLPSPSLSMLRQAINCGEAPVCLSDIDGALLSHLRRLSANDLARYDSDSEGFQNRLAQAIRDGAGFEAICEHAQTRRYPLARVRRALLRAWLDLPLDECGKPPAYLRVLAIGPQGRALLRLFSKTARVPLITKPLHEKELPEMMQPTLARDVLGDDLYALAFSASDRRVGGSHFRKTPYCDSSDA